MINRELISISSVVMAICRNASSVGIAGPACLLAFVFLSLFLPATVSAQTQLGADINGEAAGDHFGYPVSLSSDGYRLAAGAGTSDGNGDNSGHASVYQWSGTAWTQLGANIDGEAVGDYSGSSISLSSDGNRLAVGAFFNDGNGADSGHVRVYHWSGTVWTQLGGDIDGEVAGDYSGYSVSLTSDGNRLAIGAYRNDGNGDNSGHARVYQWSGTDWAQLGTDIDGEVAGDYSGYSVSLTSDGNRLAIGAHRNDGNGDNSGHARVYQWSGMVWTQLGGDIAGEVAGDRSGTSISLSSDGNRLAVGAPSNDGNGDRSGHVRVYHWSGTVWTQLGGDIDGEVAGDGFGVEFSVSLSSDGHRLAVGAPFNDGNGDRSGHVRVYHWSGTDWAQLGTDIDGEVAGDESGYGVSLSSDGNRLAVGALNNDGSGTDSGHVRVYDLSMFSTFTINAGLNDAWFYEPTSGQGFFITVFPDLGYVSLAWFTYDTELPLPDAVANLGDPGHRWITAIGPIEGNQVTMNIEMTSGGIFDTATLIDRTDPPGSDGTIILTFDNCNSGIVEYDIPSINRQGTVPIQRVAGDNIVICEALRAD